MTTKLCKDCKYCEVITILSDHYHCTRDPAPPDKVTGEPVAVFCSARRVGPWLVNFLTRDCGETARYWEPKQ